MSQHDNLGTESSGDDENAGKKSPSSEDNDKKAGRRKINIEFIEDKSRRHITFSKRKAGIMKKAYELSTLTGTQVLLLVASETGHVYTFATPKLQPLITKPEGKNLIQACLNAPETPPVNPSSQRNYSSQDNQEQNEQLYEEAEPKTKVDHKNERNSRVKQEQPKQVVPNYGNVEPPGSFEYASNYYPPNPGNVGLPGRMPNMPNIYGQYPSLPVYGTAPQVNPYPLWSKPPNSQASLLMLQQQQQLQNQQMHLQK